jgi:hypothetical protein
MIESTQVENTENSEAFDVHSIFAKKTEPKTDLPKEEVKEKTEEKKESYPAKKPVKEESRKEVSENDNDEDQEDDEDEEKEVVSSKKDQKDDSNIELEKTQKALKETQKWGNEARKQLASYRKTIEKLKDDGILTDDEARALQDHTIVHADEPKEEASQPVLYGQIWDKELEYMKKYSPNAKEIDESASAFTHLVNHCTQEELRDIFDDLGAYEDDEVALTKRMIEIGREYYDDIYGDIHESGSIRNLKKKYKEKEDVLQKRIDKLEAKYNKLKEKYEDFDDNPSGMKLPSGGLQTSLPKDVTFDTSAIFQKRNQKR